DPVRARGPARRAGAGPHRRALPEAGRDLRPRHAGFRRAERRPPRAVGREARTRRRRLDAGARHARARGAAGGRRLRDGPQGVEGDAGDGGQPAVDGQRRGDRRPARAVHRHPAEAAESDRLGRGDAVGDRARGGAAAQPGVREARAGARIARAGAVGLHRGAVRAGRHAGRHRARRGRRHRPVGAAPAADRTAVADAALRETLRAARDRGIEGVVPITAVLSAIRESVFDWRNTRAADLLFTHRDTAVLTLVAVIGLCVAVLIVRAMTRRKAGRTQIALPALLDWSGQSSWLSLVRHGALILFLAGVPFFAMALADPYSTLTQETVSYPGRRIALMIDASSSMMARFPAAHLNAKAPNEATFFTTVAAAEAFIRQRMSGKYHDLIGLIEFGDEAYVVTPFTTDYSNILLSLTLIGDWTEFMKFPDQGTTIGLAMEQSTNLFRAFNFLDAAGNLMVLFT